VCVCPPFPRVQGKWDFLCGNRDPAIFGELDPLSAGPSRSVWGGLVRGTSLFNSCLLSNNVINVNGRGESR